VVLMSPLLRERATMRLAEKRLGNIRVMGKIWGTIDPRFFPKARILPVNLAYPPAAVHSRGRRS